MSDEFKLFINSKAKTKEEIVEEVRRVIDQRMKNEAAEIVIPPEGTEAKGEKIPPRKPTEQKKADAPAAADIGDMREEIRSRINSVIKSAVMELCEPRKAARPAAEKRDNISYSTGRVQQNDLFGDALAYLSETVSGSSVIEENIREMRSLNQMFYNGYMLRQCAEITLVKQGEFVKDITDDYGFKAFCAIERPIYGALSTAQLRTYFTWRTDVRRGVYEPIDKPYVVLYCYELLNKIGVISSDDAFNRLLGVWESCRSFCPSLDKIMPRWLKDFCAYNNITVTDSPEEVFPVNDVKIDKDISDVLSHKYSNKLDLLHNHSQYNVKGSKFCTEENRPLLEGALEAVLTDVDRFFESKEVSLPKIIGGTLRRDYEWIPFLGAYVDLDRMDGFHSCRISAYEQYSVKRSQPCREALSCVYFGNFVGYILKMTEAVLRKRTGFKHPLSPNLNLAKGDFRNRPKPLAAVEDPEFPAVIQRAAERWCDEYGIFPPKKERKAKPKIDIYNDITPPSSEPVKVEIDLSKLAQIRRESDEIAQRLVIDEQPPEIPQPEEITGMIERIEEETFDERMTIAADTVHAEEQPCLWDLSSLPDGWRELAQQLGESSLRVLHAAAEGTAEQLCRSMGVMPEAAFEQINACALEYIGDVLIEGGEIVPDYIEDVMGIVSCME